MKVSTPTLPSLETAIVHNLWGYRWAAIASANGVAAAAMEPLPARAEEQAQVQATIYNELGMLSGMSSHLKAMEWAARALKAYDAVQPELDRQRAQAPSTDLLRDTKIALVAA